jgi:hypothetical protein
VQENRNGFLKIFLLAFVKGASHECYDNDDNDDAVEDKCEGKADGAVSTFYLLACDCTCKKVDLSLHHNPKCFQIISDTPPMAPSSNEIGVTKMASHMPVWGL